MTFTKLQLSIVQYTEHDSSRWLTCMFIIKTMVNSGNQLVSASQGLLQDWSEIPQHWFIYQKSNSVNHGVNDGVINGFKDLTRWLTG